MTTIANITNSEPWCAEAVCTRTTADGNRVHDPDLWHPTFMPNGGTRAPTASSHPAVQLCMACPVRTQCLEFAYRTDQRHGIWGGLTPSQRAPHRRYW